MKKAAVNCRSYGAWIDIYSAKSIDMSRLAALLSRRCDCGGRDTMLALFVYVQASIYEFQIHA
jgi:translation initiation factor 1 (eIF-1/SUI1)